METSETAPPCSLFVRRMAYGALGLYWLILFTATHIPRLPPPPSLLPSDKLHHFLAYGLLTILLMMAMASSQRLRAAHYLRAFLILAIYGVLDELSQIPVGRSAEFLDWVADVTGVVLALAAFAVGSRLWESSRKGESSSSSV